MSPASRISPAKPDSSARSGRTEIIRSRDNRWLKMFRAALHSAQPEENRLGVEGPRIIGEALRAGLAIEALLASDTGERHLASLAAHAVPEIPILRTSDRLFAGISATEAPQGIAALVRAPEHSFEDLLHGDVPLVVVLVGVQDPGNVGAILRSAEALGATGAIACPGTAHPLSPKALRASAGSALRFPVLSGITITIALAQLRVSGLRIIAATSEKTAAANPPDKLDFRDAAALLVGNEGAGLPPEVVRSADAVVRIPLAATADSLNAAIATSVLLYEAARQRRVKAKETHAAHGTL